MNDIHEEEVRRRLERLGALEPAPKATQHAVERVRRALAENPGTHVPSRRRIMLKRVAAAAAVLLVAGSLLAWLLPATPSAEAALADVQAAMKAPRSLTCRQTTRIEGKPDETIRLFILDNGLCRVELSDGSYIVMDTGKYRALHVNPQKRQATLLLGANAPQINLYEALKNLPGDTSARALPGKKIDGKEVLGFTVNVLWCGQRQDLSVWADVKTRLPVRIEAKGKDDEGVLEDFLFDKKLDAKLFALEPPPGFKLETKGIAELPAAPDDPRLRDLVVTPLKGLGPVTFGMSRAEVEKVLGPPDAVQKVGKYGTVDMNYGSRGFFLGVSKTSGVFSITCVAQKVMAVRVRDFGGKTDKGVALGASAADIIRAYGQPDSKKTNRDSTYLSYDKLQLHYTLFSDELVQISVWRPRP